jgi:hypothetical protein
MQLEKPQLSFFQPLLRATKTHLILHNIAQYFSNFKIRELM